MNVLHIATTEEFDEKPGASDMKQSKTSRSDNSGKKVIDFWQISGNVNIYPHLVFEKKFSYVELLSIVKDIQTHLFKDKMDIFKDNDYCCEVNGQWNVCFGIKDHNGNTYTYMIRRDYKLNKSYACPFYNNQYGYDLNHYIFDRKTMPIQFEKLETFLKNEYSGREIKCFQTEL